MKTLNVNPQLLQLHSAKNQYFCHSFFHGDFLPHEKIKNPFLLKDESKFLQHTTTRILVENWYKRTH